MNPTSKPATCQICAGNNDTEMYSLEDIKARSVSQTDLVVSYTDALELLYIYQNMNMPVSGWKGFFLHKNGQLTHSIKHQGPTELSSIPQPSAFALAKNTIMQSNTEWQTQPEVPGADLFFCITSETDGI